MKKKIYKITEEQYARLTEEDIDGNNGSSKINITTPKDSSSIQTAANIALSNDKIGGIKFSDTNSSNSVMSEDVITKKELVAEARRDWKKGTRVVKMSELLKS